MDVTDLVTLLIYFAGAMGALFLVVSTAVIAALKDPRAVKALREAIYRANTPTPTRKVPDAQAHLNIRWA